MKDGLERRPAVSIGRWQRNSETIAIIWVERSVYWNLLHTGDKSVLHNFESSDLKIHRISSRS